MEMTMLVQMMMQVMGDGGVRDTFTLSLCCLSLGKTNFLQVLISNLVEKIKQMHVLFILTKFYSLFYHCNMMFLHNMIFLPFCQTLTLGSQPR
jgi:hypothetical protein